MNRPPFEIPWDESMSNWEIPLRYYRGWTIQFSVRREKFDCPMFSLFNFNSVGDLEIAMDRAIQYRDGINPTCKCKGAFHSDNCSLRVK